MGALGKVWLTGGHGMVGSNILASPEASDWTFLAPSSQELDLRDYAAVERFVKVHQPDIVIHAAGRVGGIQANMANPVDFLVTNVDLGRNVVMAAYAAGVKKVLNLASSCMYPCNAENPLHEDAVLTGELEPTNEGYALAKIFALRLCQYISRQDGSFQYKTLIPCNLYGKFDKFDPRHSHLIPAILRKLHLAKTGGESVVEIWGDGLARREFMYAGDVASVVFKALREFDTLPGVMNIGLGHDYTINEYYEAAAKVVGWHGSFVHDLSRPVGMKQKLVSVEQQTKWGWQPLTPLLQGLAKTYKFYLESEANEF